ncbi:MAG: hypothetical protein HY674_08635 [Chloroflexi bacterium]|nr:hypothetical protein [Chloroflexota bacterium]
MHTEIILQGRPFGPEALAQVRQFLRQHPGWSRYRLSRHLAALWDWRNPAGQLKDVPARISAVCRVEDAGEIDRGSSFVAT